MLSNRSQGDAWEEQVLHMLEPYIHGLKKTIGSGSVFGDQDLVSNDFRFSVKLRTSVGLSQKELLEPYGREAINSSRCPITILRSIFMRPDEDYTDLVLTDGLIVMNYGKDLLRTAMIDTVDTVSNLFGTEQKYGLTPRLASTITERHVTFIEIPSGKLCILTRLNTFVNILAHIQELVSQQLMET